MEPDPGEGEDDQSPIQQSIEIHRRRITNILERMIEKLCIGCCLKDLRTTVDTNLMSLREYSSLLRMSGIAKKSSFASSVRSIRSSTRKGKAAMSKNFSPEFMRDTRTSHMIAILHHNPEIMRAVKDLVTQMPPEEKKFIDEITEFKNYIVELLNTSASAERAYNKQIGEAYVNNEKYKHRNAEMEKIHDSKMYEHSIKINEKENVIASYKNQIAQSNEMCRNDLQRIVNESEKQMVKTKTASEEEQEILSEEAKYVANKYQTLLEDHLKHEKVLRTKRYKVETVLAGWLAKFDQDVGELQEQLEEQQDGYNAEKKLFDDLTEKTGYQIIEHERLMTEKAEEEQKAFDKKRWLFIANRSARIIQRWWRKIYNKWFVKRKNKGKKGKKK